jgi:hypothetical protein
VADSGGRTPFRPTPLGGFKNEDDRREAMSLARMFLSARENAQRCAVDCDRPMTEQEAKALGLTVSATLLVAADEVIE